MAKKRPRRTRFSDSYRHAIVSCGVSRYRIAKKTGISEATLSRFMTGQRGLTIEALDALAHYLDLQIAAGRQPLQKNKEP